VRVAVVRRERRKDRAVGEPDEIRDDDRLVYRELVAVMSVDTVGPKLVARRVQTEFRASSREREVRRIRTKSGRLR
jgi:hypothetical protein